MSLDVVETLCDLVSLPSVNPMGRDASGDEFYEHRMTDRLEEIFKQLGCRARGNRSSRSAATSWRGWKGATR